MWWIIDGSQWSPLLIHGRCTIFINFSSLSHSSLYLSFHGLKAQEKKRHVHNTYEREWWKGKENESPSPDVRERERERYANYKAHWVVIKGSTILFFHHDPLFCFCFDVTLYVVGVGLLSHQSCEPNVGFFKTKTK